MKFIVAQDPDICLKDEFGRKWLNFSIMNKFRPTIPPCFAHISEDSYVGKVPLQTVIYKYLQKQHPTLSKQEIQTLADLNPIKLEDIVGFRFRLSIKRRTKKCG